jgi:hypothetical protein
MKPETTVDLSEIQPDALITGTRPLELTPIAGKPAETLTEHLRLARYDKIVTIVVHEVGLLGGDLRPFIGADAEAAEVHFIRVREELRRDGWNLTEVPTATTEHAPF